mgnify:CR=1 FL=1
MSHWWWERELLTKELWSGAQGLSQDGKLQCSLTRPACAIPAPFPSTALTHRRSTP